MLEENLKKDSKNWSGEKVIFERMGGGVDGDDDS